VVALPGDAEVFGAAVLGEGLDDGGQGGGAFGGEVAADAAGAVEGGVEDQVPVAEPAPGRVFFRVGLPGAPGLVGGLGEELEVVQVRPGRGRLGEDAVGFLLEVFVVDAAGPPGELPRPRQAEGAGGGHGVEVRVAGHGLAGTVKWPAPGMRAAGLIDACARRLVVMVGVDTRGSRRRGARCSGLG
jgi:hypothetical protein